MLLNILDPDNVRMLVYLGMYIFLLLCIGVYSAIKEFHSTSAHIQHNHIIASTTKASVTYPTSQSGMSHIQSSATDGENDDNDTGDHDGDHQVGQDGQDGHFHDIGHIRIETGASTPGHLSPLDVDCKHDLDGVGWRSARDSLTTEHIQNNPSLDPLSSQNTLKAMNSLTTNSLTRDNSATTPIPGNHNIRFSATTNNNSNIPAMTYGECFRILVSAQFCRSICTNMMRQRGIYGTILVYAFDIITDMNVMIHWFNNLIKFGVLALLAILTYRSVSAYSVYHATTKKLGRKRRVINAILQFLDVYILYEVLNSHQKGSRTSKLLWINAMEAALESAPLLVFQIVYLIKHNDSESGLGGIVVVGLFFSVCKLGATVIGADRFVKSLLFVFMFMVCNFCVII